jgi:hypothetical protein
VRSPGEQRALKLQETHRDKVARNELQTSLLWAGSCRAYNVQIELNPATRASLELTQRNLKRAESNLLVCPRETLHVSVAWLLAVHASYAAPKVPSGSDTQASGPRSCNVLRPIARLFGSPTNTSWLPTPP